MKTKRVVTGIILVTVMAVLLGLSAPVSAQPALPHAFYGTLKIDGAQLSAGTIVKATGTGVDTDITGNPIVTTEKGWYGSADPLGAKLIVQGANLTEGTTLTFFVKGEATGQTWQAAKPKAEWHSGEITRLDLTLAKGVGEGEGAGGGGGGDEEGEAEAEIGPNDLFTNLFGSELTFSISDTGEILDTITACSPDGRVCITIPAGTIALDRNQNPITSLIIEGNPDPVCPLVEGAHIIGLAYDFKPDRATFDPPITLVFTYDDDEVPEGVAEEDLVLAYCDETSLKWIEVASEVNAEDNTITANIYHFTCFAILYYEVKAEEVPPTPEPTPPTPTPAAFTISSLSISPVEVNVDEVVTISLTVTNTGGQSGEYQVTLKINGEVEDTKEILIDAGASQEVKFTTSKNVAGTYTVDCNGLVGSFVVKEIAVAPPAEAPTEPGEEPLNWPVLGGFIAAVIVVISLVIFFVVRRRSAY